MNDLDRPFFAALSSNHDINWSEVPFNETERVKQYIYQGKPYTLLLKGRDAIKLGGKQDQDAFQSQATRFTSQLWEKFSDFISHQKPTKVYMTGGGGLIPALVEPFGKHLKASNILVATSNSDQNLQRAATSLGGASLILQVPGLQNDPEDGHPRRLPKIPNPLPDSYATCSCQGANKDCCYCGGRGFYTR